MERATGREILAELAEGRPGAAERLFPLVYSELKEIAGRHLRRERPSHTLQATALVHEVWLKLAGQEKDDYAGRTHFLGVAAEAMRRVLLDHARGRGRKKRGGGWARVTLSGIDLKREKSEADAISLAEALERLAALDEQQARIVRLRFFAGLNVAEVAELIGISRRTVERDWTHARAWLARELS